ncbi:hypothetical protein AVEN_174155-1 [Araneus ventricosus]|uniref:Uncharacterized protein n=1 Tax=Araneus ventricosus TaxID=182803 RepID=A0A4Y2EHQ1_ARAVE|nr:hypothetical protein AVEN_174155-1 [Araneus ventricosus]
MLHANLNTDLTRAESSKELLEGTMNNSCSHDKPIGINNPGPAAYKLPSTNVNKRKPPAYTMGLRTMSQRIGTATPGPASNELHLVTLFFSQFFSDISI